MASAAYKAGTSRATATPHSAAPASANSSTTGNCTRRILKSMLRRRYTSSKSPSHIMPHKSGQWGSRKVTPLPMTEICR
ncbi:hypothetical protein D3C75_750000 [compost metagenome]